MASILAAGEFRPAAGTSHNLWPVLAGGEPLLFFPKFKFVIHWITPRTRTRLMVFFGVIQWITT